MENIASRYTKEKYFSILWQQWMLRVMLTEGNYYSPSLVLWKIKKKKDGACHKILLLENICKSFHAVIPLNCADISFCWLSLLASKPCMKIHSQEVRQRDTDRKGDPRWDQVHWGKHSLFHSHVSWEIEVRNHHVVQAWKKDWIFWMFQSEWSIKKGKPKWPV